ncbi:MMPL family transporter [Spelaeicoccus albus]|uniref:RND superfamily putative drug exporter n=1 Tax=Spelaeicoccus albus TaxID=1280376 RepID=A0A7Z0ACE1_9MICO|nr:MMPL family transporter [Spelaeicoccus albus]NYI66621.1 RND superfamily putative drug exporter [Spelaeicoccus albus]
MWHWLSGKIVARKGAWATLLIALIVAGGAIGAMSKSDPPGAVNSLPSAAESAQVQKLRDEFPGSELSPVLAVFSRGGDALTTADKATALDVGKKLAADVGHRAGRPIMSKDGEAAIVSVPINADRSNSEIADTVDKLRTTARDATSGGLHVQITGGPAFGADIASAFDGANFTLLAVTVGIVAILLLTYRSPVLWLVPLAVVAFADEAANVVTAKVGDVWNLQFDAGIISVLVFGAGTNYALLLISRYREELRRKSDHRVALRTALRATAPAIVASNVTVVLSLLTLVLAAMPSSRGLGIASAIGLAIALGFALLVLPPFLAVCGRRLFWPFIPRVGDEEKSERGVWSTIARTVTAKPVLTIGMSIIVLAVLGSGLIGTKVGLSQTQQFRVASESAQGFETLADHYPAGESEPMIVMARTNQAGAVLEAISGVDGVERANPIKTSTSGWTEINVVGKADPQTDASYRTVRELRTAVHDVPAARAAVGGQIARSLDVKTFSTRDLRLIAPIILGLVFIVLVILLRSLLAPILLVAVNAASAVAAIGAGTWVGKHVFGFPALDVNVPLLAFLFLVALGIDYTIFIAHRALHESQLHGTREGMVISISRTGAVITSAGVVLAAVFAALGVLPLVTLGQLGLIVGLGVLVDTLFVRTVFVPAIFAAIGDRIWWPRTPVRTAGSSSGTGNTQSTPRFVART